MRVPAWRQTGQEPDHRFSLANERTFLAWIRTALALVAGGVLLDQFATKLAPRGALMLLAVGLAVVAAVLGALAYLRWKHNEIAMRHQQPLPASFAMPLLSTATLVVSAVLAWLMLRG